MAETRETVSDYLRFGAGLQEASAAHAAWLPLEADQPVEPQAPGADWTPAREGRSSPGRWAWKFRRQHTGRFGGVIASMRRSPLRVLVVGDGGLGDRVVAELRAQPGYEVVGHIHKQTTPDLFDGDEVQCDPLEGLDKIAVRDGVECIVVAAPERRGDLPMEELLACRFRGIRVEDAVWFYERLTRKIPLEGLRPSHMLFHGGFRWPSRVAKRVTDLLLATLLFLCTLPLFVLLPLLIKLTSPGPVLYRQERLGLDGRPFMIYKFRSMFHNAELPGRAMWAEEHDPRVTPLGRFMRQYRLDELPQVLNVLRGEMSMVGPRPERPEFIARLSKEVPFYPYRLAVKPGITGWAQVRFRYGATVQDAAEKLQYDLYYIKHMSLRLDSLIALKTLHTVLFQNGAR